jgi:Na+-translocating ferredoxin:NAD+ oxidoreductase RnfG subunit
MNIVNNIFIFLILTSLITSQILAGEIRDKALKSIKTNYGDKVLIESYKLNIIGELKTNSEKFAKQKYFIDYIYLYKIFNDATLIGYALLDNVLGKVKPITYIVLFKTDYSIAGVEIIKYREQIGGAIQNRDWLEQFREKSIKSNFEIGEGIDGISGATISTKALSKGVKRLIYLISNMRIDETDLLISVE